MLIARTDSDAPKHQGIIYFAIDMHQPGIEVRPLREMTGRAMFNEVFLTDARVADDAIDRRAQRRLGGRQHDARVRARRSRIGRRPRRRQRGDRRARSPVTSTMRAGDFVASKRGVGGGAQFRGAGRLLIDLAKSTGGSTTRRFART